ncbi:MAG: hypothetical protein HYV60_05065, partial [Planctomycetia bacterium]|nr:hypothetical protein [Planctomycetia bacterium]
MEPIMRPLTVLSLILLLGNQAAFADGPRDNIAENVRQIPPAGIAVPAEDRAALEQ